MKTHPPAAGPCCALLETTRPRRGGSLLFTAFAALLSCAVPGTAALDGDAWREDLAFLVETIEAVHPDPWFRRSAEDFEAERRRIHEALPEMTAEQAVVAFKRLAASIEDGHTGLDPTGPVVGIDRWFPVLIDEYADGLHVSVAPAGREDLVGARVVRFAGRPAEEAWRAAYALADGDNRMSRSYRTPAILAQADLLLGLGVVDSTEALELEVVTRAGDPRTVTLPSFEAPHSMMWFWTGRGRTLPDGSEGASVYSLGIEEPLGRSRRTEYQWFELLLEADALYARIDLVFDAASFPMPGFEAPYPTLAGFFAAMFAELDASGAGKLILDLRHNPGGNNRLAAPLVEGILARPRINERGKLFVITGRATYSAAMNTVSLLAEHTEALFAGEPAGGSPIHHGDNTGFRLPNSKMGFSVSLYRWDIGSLPWHQERMIVPQLPAPVTAADFFSGRDAALERVLAYEDYPPLSDLLVAVWEAEGLEPAVGAYDRYKQERPDVAWWTSEADLVETAERIAAQHGDEAGIEVFARAVGAYPEGTRLWRALGKAYLEAGKRAEAREAFGRALENDPANRFTRRMVEAMGR